MHHAFGDCLQAAVIITMIFLIYNVQAFNKIMMKKWYEIILS